MTTLPPAPHLVLGFLASSADEPPLRDPVEADEFVYCPVEAAEVVREVEAAAREAERRRRGR